MLCSSWTNKLITAKDHASIQINVGNLDDEGVYNGAFATYALRGQVRSRVRAFAAPAFLRTASCICPERRSCKQLTSLTPGLTQRLFCCKAEPGLQHVDTNVHVGGQQWLQGLER